METSGPHAVGATSCAESEPQARSPDAAGARILLVEHDDLLRVLFGVILGQAGFDVVSVADGRSALSEIDSAARPIEAVVTEVALGAGPSGWSVAFAARARWPACRVLYLTAAGADARSLGGVADAIYLGKPFDVARMADVLQTLFDTTR
jgi:DNA-binding response OmpR family regulator